MSFETNRLALTQEHFSVIEIDLPAFSSGQTCTLTTGTAFFTPRSCDETWDGTTYKTYYFATTNTPINFGRPKSASGMPSGIIDTGASAIYRVLKGISESVTELKPGEGLALKGSAKITLADFVGDPGPVTETTTGTFFGKLSARNILTNKVARVKHFHVNSDNIYETDDALTRYYIIDTLKNNGNGSWTLNLKDELSKLDKDKHQFPIPTGGSIRTAISNSVTTIPVDLTTDWEQIARPYTVKVGDELMKVSAVADNQGTATTLTVAARGSSITYTNLLSSTPADTHDAGDDVQICYTADNENIARVLQDVMYSAGIIVADYGTDEGTITLIVSDMVEVEAGHTAGGTVSNVYKSITATGSTDLTAEDYSIGAAWEDLGAKKASIAAWKAEIAEWHATDKVNTIWHEPTSANDVVKQITNDFLLDVWFDNEDREVKLSAISVWKVTGPVIEQGKGINRNSFKIKPKDDMRYSRAFIYWNKLNKVKNNDIENFRNLSITIDSTFESEGLYGEPKAKEFKNSSLLDAAAANLLTQRYVARFGFTPMEYTWNTEERFLNFKTGDIATLITSENQDFDGTTKEERAQILSVQPVYSPANGRSYKVKALTYEPAFASGAEQTKSSDSNNQSVYAIFGAPSGATNVTLIIDGAVFSSNDTGIPALIAGGFASGSVITIILINGAELEAAGGIGGYGGNSTVDIDEDSNTFMTNAAGGAGGSGGVVYDAQGVDTKIYLAGAAPGSRTGDGTLKAPGGGGGGEDGQGTGTDTAIGGESGGGGAGNSIGQAGGKGIGSNPFAPPNPTDGVAGSPGSPAGTGGAAGGAGSGAGGAWGAAGSAGDGAGGAAGKGIVAGGATVTVYYDGDSALIINGGGDSFTIG